MPGPVGDVQDNEKWVIQIQIQGKTLRNKERDFNDAFKTLMNWLGRTGWSWKSESMGIGNNPTWEPKGKAPSGGGSEGPPSGSATLFEVRVPGNMSKAQAEQLAVEISKLLQTGKVPGN